MPRPGSRPVSVARLFLGGTETAIAEKAGKAEARAAALRRSHPTWSTDRLAKSVVDRYVATVTVVGGGAGAAAAIPAAGFVTGLALTTADLGIYGLATARMILTVAALYDVDLRREDIRRIHVLGILAGDEAAIAAAAEMAGTADKLTASSVQLLNNRLARNVTLRVGTRMVSARMATLIPLGIGAIAGGGVNFLLGRGVGHRAISSFRNLRLRSIDQAPPIVTTATVAAPAWPSPQPNPEVWRS